jgi:hypothetical protein
MPYFPFGDAVISVSSAYSPRRRGRDETRFLVLYRLDKLPKTIYGLGEEEAGESERKSGGKGENESEERVAPVSAGRTKIAEDVNEG